MLRRLMQLGVTVNEFIDVHDYTAVHHAVLSDDYELLDLLLESGADVNKIGELKPENRYSMNYFSCKSYVSLMRSSKSCNICQMLPFRLNNLL